MSLVNEIETLLEKQTKITENKVANFAYTDKAYTEDTANGVDSYDEARENNIPNPTADILKVNTTVLEKGYRAKASPLTRMIVNHFFGRLSYNTNKANDNLKAIISLLNSYLDKADGIPVLDSDTKLPVSKLHTNEAGGILKLGTDGLVEDSRLHSDVVKTVDGIIPMSLLSTNCADGVLKLSNTGLINSTFLSGDTFFKYKGTYDPSSSDSTKQIEYVNGYTYFIGKDGNIPYSEDSSSSFKVYAGDFIAYRDGTFRRFSPCNIDTVNNVSPFNKNVTLTSENIPVFDSSKTLCNTSLYTQFSTLAGRNCVFGGRDITDLISVDDFCTSLYEDGDSLKYDILVGDYWVFDNTKYRIVEFDPFYNIHGLSADRSNASDKTFEKRHHVVIMPDEAMWTARWDNNNTNGGYSSSEIRSICENTLNDILPNDLKEHSLSVRMPISNGASNGVITGMWSETLGYNICHVPSITELFGGISGLCCDSSNNAQIVNTETINNLMYSGITHQFACFRLNPSLIGTSTKRGIDFYWTRNISAGTNSSAGDATKAFAVYRDGISTTIQSRAVTEYGTIRPWFCIG